MEKTRTMDQIIDDSFAPRKDRIIHINEIEDSELATPFPTGIKQLDDCVLGGIRGGDLWLISGISKHGKTQLSLQMTKSFSNENSETGVVPTLWFSFEMPLNALKWRFKNMGVDLSKVLIYVPKENTSNKVDWLEDRILDSKQRFDTQVVFIDNLDFLEIDRSSNDDKLTMQKRIVGMLKRIAIEKNIAIVLNAHTKKIEENKKPTMQSIYGASEAYKLADLIMFIYREQEKDAYGENKGFSSKSELIIDGNRLTGINRNIKLNFRNNLFYEN